MGITLCLVSKHVATLGLNPYLISRLEAHSKSDTGPAKTKKVAESPTARE